LRATNPQGLDFFRDVLFQEITGGVVAMKEATAATAAAAAATTAKLTA